jgi:hypothetical protein
MSPEASLSRCTNTWLKRGRTARPDEQHGVPDRGRIVKLFAGPDHDRAVGRKLAIAAPILVTAAAVLYAVLAR